jgi:hypothetical protein
MESKNIPSYVLAKGISKEGFDVLLDNIKVAALEDGVNKFNKYEEMIDEVKQKENGVISQEEIEQWVVDFEMQLKESSDIINDNINQIETLFNRIFEDWDKYKVEHGIVEENTDVIEEQKEEVVEQEFVEESPTENETEQVASEEVPVSTEEVKEDVVSSSSEEEIDAETKEKEKEAKKEKKSRKKKARG